jgi:hypothetical protein
MEASKTGAEDLIAVPRALLTATLTALRVGADAILDRDWDQYADWERVEAATYVEVAFMSVAEQLERLLGP